MSEETEVNVAEDELAPEIVAEEKIEPATVEDLVGKARTSRVVTLVIDGRRRSLRFESMPGDQYDELERQHKPEAADVDRAGRSLLWNPRTFPPALVAASLAEPLLSETDVRRIWSSPNWSKGDRQLLFSAAYEVNNISEDLIDLGKGFGLTP